MRVQLRRAGGAHRDEEFAEPLPRHVRYRNEDGTIELFQLRVATVLAPPRKDDPAEIARVSYLQFYESIEVYRP